MRTLDELRRIPLPLCIPGDFDSVTADERARLRAFYARLGRLCERMPPRDILMSQAIGIAKTWRGTFAWELAAALARIPRDAG